MRNGFISKIWDLKIPLKVKVFCWLVLKRRALTRDTLAKRGILSDSTCVLCGLREETVDHLFCQCVFSKFIIIAGLEDIQAPDLENDVELAWERWSGSKVWPTKRTRLTDLVSCWWTIWKLRNDLIFRNRPPNPDLAAQRPKILLKEWEQVLPS